MAEQEILNVRLGEGDGSVVLLDQSQLPNRVEYRTVTQLPDMVEAIQSLRVRAPRHRHLRRVLPVRAGPAAHGAGVIRPRLFG